MHIFQTHCNFPWMFFLIIFPFRIQITIVIKYNLMNPQNVGPHIPLRHSLLWRQPLQYQKPVSKSKYCHLQLNEMGASGQSWRTRNNLIEDTYTFQKKKSGHKSNNKKLLKKQDKSRDNMIDGTPQNGKLINEMQKMKGSRVTVAAYPGVIRQEYILNDFHSKVTNPGYSRNSKGKYFTS